MLKNRIKNPWCTFVLYYSHTKFRGKGIYFVAYVNKIKHVL
jgi:hypothetical protein